MKKPKLIIAGASAYSLVIDWKRFRAIADKVGALFMADMAHYAGLIAAGLYPSPVGIADFVTSTTHKTLRGPRGGLILANARAREGAQLGGVSRHCRAGRSCTSSRPRRWLQGSADAASSRTTRSRCSTTRASWRKCMQERGFRIVSGRTDCHLFLVDLRAKNLTGRDAEAALGKAHITVNKNAVPHDPQKPFITSGIRIGSPAMTTRGLEELEAEQLANLICRRARCAATTRSRVAAK